MLFRKRLIDRESERKIVAAIQEAELKTSGEVRVHIERKCPGGDPIARAIHIFNAIGMYKTAQRNGVLIYVALESHKFSIIGDTGINKVIPDNFWNSVRDSLKESLACDDVAGGICRAISSTGEILKKDFPYLEGDVNEQSDEISYGK